MSDQTISADKDVDARYEFLRAKHGQKNARANGYRMQSFFEREQNALLTHIDLGHGPFLDLACGSGLMLEPLIQKGHTPVGLDFNNQACIDAKTNGINAMRGDAFNLPLADNSVGQITNCQFLNQQSPEQTKKFISESARILKSGGQIIILWRHAGSLLHQSAHFLFTIKDRFTGQPPFPQFKHTIKALENYGKENGLVVEKTAITLPFLKPHMISAKNPIGKIIGASLFIVLKKP